MDKKFYIPKLNNASFDLFMTKVKLQDHSFMF